MGSIEQDLQHNHPNLGTKRICHSTLLEIEITCDVSGNNLPECAALGARMTTQRDTPRTAWTQIEMMDYYDHDERERKQMHHSSGPVRIYRAGRTEKERATRAAAAAAGMAAAEVGTLTTMRILIN